MAKYTGLRNNWGANTSISIGYLGELYVDFGFLGAILASGVIGGLGGFAYRILSADRSAPALITAASCLIIALPLADFGMAYIKLVSYLLFSIAIAFAAHRLIKRLTWGGWHQKVLRDRRIRPVNVGKM
jgi:hypothetical protein